MVMGWTPDPFRGWLPPDPVRPHNHDPIRSPDRPWLDWTPSTNGVALGTGGSIFGRYKKLDGRTVTGRVHMKLGTGGSVTNTIQIGLPPNILPGGGSGPGAQGIDQVSLASAWDVTSGVAGKHDLGICYFESAGPASSGAIIVTFRSGTGFWDADNPFVWAAGDELVFNFTIEAVQL